MGGKCCFFIGHREADESLYVSLEKTIERHITQYGVTIFIVGGYGGFDRLASRILVELKKKYPSIQLFRLLVYHPGERPIKTPKGFDGTIYPPDMERVPRKAAIIRANRYMVDHADYLIAYAWHSASNARNLLEYACRRAKSGKLNVMNLYEEE
ncbi:MAG: hypothetical protein J6L88_06060 [Clostridia bacterium]|nr:hypothetical protein [Clostridia bacterium]